MITTRGDDARVVVTGCGVVSSIGIGVEAFAASLQAGRSAIGPITAFETEGFDHHNAGGLRDFDATPYLTGFDNDGMGPTARLAVAAARLAVEDAGRTAAELQTGRGLVAIGTTDGESQDLDRLVHAEFTDGGDALDPVIAARLGASRLSTSVVLELDLGRDVEAITIPTACSAGNYAIGYAVDAIRAGDTDWAVCGGADALCRKTFAAFYRLGALAPEQCRPFDVDREGILVAEGAGVLFFESLSSARARGARIYAEVLGYGLGCDAAHPVAPDEDSVARTMQLALVDAGVAASEVDLISAHGTGTKANDLTETRAIRTVFGDTPPRTVAIKSMLGHTMGAASALATIACALAIDRGFVPPTINHVTTDPECAIDCVPNVSVAAELSVVQNNAMAFGGNNAVVLLGRLDRSARAVESSP